MEPQLLEGAQRGVRQGKDFFFVIAILVICKTRHFIFLQRKKQFADSKKSEDPFGNIDAAEMSVFYKEFLDERWSAHIKYNVEWQKRNFSLLWLSAKLAVANATSGRK